MLKPKTIFLIGISGSGKGTQAKNLIRRLKPAHHLETGRLLRRHLEGQTLLGRFIAATVKRGDLIPSWIVFSLIAGELLRRIPPNAHLIGDGTPRQLAEAEFWDKAMDDLGRPPPVAVYIALPEREAMRRLLKRGRGDDTLQAIRRRFRFFRRDVLPVVNYYRRRGRLITVNGDQNVEGVWRDIKKALGLR